MFGGIFGFTRARLECVGFTSLCSRSMPPCCTVLALGLSSVTRKLEIWGSALLKV